MSKNLKFKIHNFRAGGQHSVMGCDLAIGYESDGAFVGVLDVRGLWLKRKQDGSGYFVSFPAKQRLKDGEPVMKNGYPVWDNHVDLFMELGANPEKPDVRGVTEAGWGFRKWLIEEMVKASQSMDAPQAGRGSPKASKPAGGKPAATPASRPAPSSRPAPAAAVAEEEEDDSGFPF